MKRLAVRSAGILAGLHLPAGWKPALLLAVAACASLAHAQPERDHFDPRLRSPAEERASFRVPPGFEVQLVASEPDIQKPLNLAFDAAGRLWVTGSTLYPWPARRDALGQPIAAFDKNWNDTAIAFRATASPPPPPEHGADTVRILSDFGPDGRARKVTVFADGLNIPVGILPLPSSSAGVPPASPRAGETPAPPQSALVFSIPAIWRLDDTDGDGRADRREKLYDGFGFKDTHGMSSSYWLWFDGWVYGTHGFANPSEVRDRSGRVTTFTSGNTYRFRPDGSRFELFTRGQTNPFGLAFDPRGDVYTADSHSKPVYLLVPGGQYEGLGLQHDGLGFAPPITLDDHGSTAIAGIAHYSAAQFPAEFRDNLFNGNPVTRRLNRARLDWRGSTPNAARQPDFLTSDDTAFRPVQVKLGPDGALWIADFYNPIIGHYESPLTHPGRDRTHGRIWRVVWRGLDGAAPVPSVPNLARENTIALASRLADPNLVVRSLAAAELLARRDAASAAPALHAAAARLIAGSDPQADGTAALPLLMTLDRLGRGDDALLRRALQRPGSDVAFAALRVLAAREQLPADAESWLAAALNAETPDYGARIAAEVFQRHPQSWQPPLILALLAKAPPADTELVYALRVAFKAHALLADAATLRAWAAANAATADRVAEVCLAVPTPAAADFLLGHLERIKFTGARAGDFARHAVLHLPPEKLATIAPLMHSLARAPEAQRVAFAEGLALVSAKPDRTLPPEIHAWMRDELAAAIESKDTVLAYRAIVAVKDLALPEKAAPLRRVALDRKVSERTRTAALRSLAAGTPETDDVLAQVLTGASPNGLRRVAAELLGTAKASPAARTALAAGLTNASADVALAIATGLAKSDDGAADLLELAARGKVPPSLLRHRYVTTALEPRPAALRERAAALTANLPPDDVRLDAVIAQRLRIAGDFKSDATRGGSVFATHCAACHRLNNAGGNIGPSLDGLAARSLPRLVEDILDPSRNVDPAFRLTTITLKSGETKAGLNHREQSGRVLLADPANGAEIALAASEVASVVPSPISPMPASFDTVLSEQEFFDLIAFLRAPGN